MTRDFIEFYDLATRIVGYDMPRERDCETIVDFFEDTYDEKSSKSSGLKYFNKTRQKICATKTLNFGEDWKVNYSNQLSDIQVKISDWQDHFKEHLGK